MSGDRRVSARARSSSRESLAWSECRVTIPNRTANETRSRARRMSYRFYKVLRGSTRFYGVLPRFVAISDLTGRTSADRLENENSLSFADAVGAASVWDSGSPQDLVSQDSVMIQAFVITLREGIEAFLIVAISLAYLKKTGRQALLSAVHWGIALSVALSIGAGVLLARANNQALWEGVLALAAAVLVASLTVHMWRAG